MRFILFLMLGFQVGCGAVTNFIVGATGNVFSDTINREVEKKINSDCQGKVE